MTVVLSVEQVILLHQEQVGAGPLLDRGKLDGAVNAPFQEGFGVAFYPTVVQKAVKLVDGISRAQAFRDGNKRLAWLALTSFLNVNGLVLVELEDGEAARWVLTLRGDEDGLREAALWLNARLETLT